MTVGVVTAFVLYLNNLFEPIQQLTQVFNSFQQAAAALKKLYGLLDEQLDLVEPEQPVELPVAGDLVVDDVSFRYAPQLDPVLHDVSLTLEHGKRLVLVGPTGAGKSTLAKLMARFYDPTEGAIRFGGVDLRDVDEATLRRRIVVIPQEGFLFTGTIRENLLTGRARCRRRAHPRRARRPRPRRAVRRLPEGPRHAGRHARDELLGG